jgi:hypothetical protein
MFAKQLYVHRSKTCWQTSLEHFDNFISTGCKKVEEVFESLTTKWLPIMRYIIHPLRLPVFFTTLSVINPSSQERLWSVYIIIVLTILWKGMATNNLMPKIHKIR